MATAPPTKPGRRGNLASRLKPTPFWTVHPGSGARPASLSCNRVKQPRFTAPTGGASVPRKAGSEAMGWIGPWHQAGCVELTCSARSVMLCTKSDRATVILMSTAIYGVENVSSP
jgi:hypothetical protein